MSKGTDPVNQQGEGTKSARDALEVDPKKGPADGHQRGKEWCIEYTYEGNDSRPKKQASIPERVAAYIAKSPPAISGQQGHKVTYKLTMTLVHGFDLSRDEALGYLEEHFNPRCDPPWSRKELEHKVDSAMRTPPSKEPGWMLKEKDRNQPAKLPFKKPALPLVDPLANIKTIIGGFRCTEDDVINVSPHKIPSAIKDDDFKRQSACLVEALFNQDDLVNIVCNSKKDSRGKRYPVGLGETLPRPEWTQKLLNPTRKHKTGVWYRFNPMDGEGITDANVTAFRYTLLEFDDIPLKLQLALLARLPLPIAAIYFSGSRSYHALVKVGANSIGEYKGTVLPLYGRMRMFGIDPNNKNPSRLSRLPGFHRDDQQQRLVYLNPDADQKGGIL